MYISINLTPELTERIEEQVKLELPRVLEEVLLANDNKILRDLISQRIRGCVMGCITEVLQEKDFRQIVRDELLKRWSL